MLTKQEFIIKTLKPYFLDSSICGYDGKRCVYLTEDGRMCAVGKWMKTGEWQNQSSNIIRVNKDYNLIHVLKKEALIQKLSVNEWYKIQKIHDALATGDTILNIAYDIRALERISKIDLTQLKELL